MQVIKAEVPLSEMLSYDAELTSMTGAPRLVPHGDVATTTRCPGHLQDKIIAASKAERGGEVQGEA